VQRGATLEPLFDILKKMDALNFEWVEVVRGLQTAEARIQELQARSPGEYVVFSQRTQQSNRARRLRVEPGRRFRKPSKDTARKLSKIRGCDSPLSGFQKRFSYGGEVSGTRRCNQHRTRP